ncbi:type II secretion system GspH family protein [Demequina sp. B12]|uniref:type II secretion system protein n=1 Tax=Demequina sp. B12 TaxID=2992757 RepID=UPI00237B131C|nr:type II secretion system protein [Demequina sp. B12]MDE0573043.1 type II secretion system GspH family protein [Demequina sp. B12]
MVSTQQVRDEGLGMVEAIVAILLFGILAVAMVPPILLSLQVTANSTTVASAGQVAQLRVEEARTASRNCAAFADFLVKPVPTTMTDSRGARYTVTETIITATGADAKADMTWCDDKSAAAVTMNVIVKSDDTHDTDVADVATLISVPGVTR